jgi:hypothetical protein
VRPVLDDTPLPQERGDHARRIQARAARDRDPVAPLDGRDRVELDTRRPPDRGLHLVGAGTAGPRRVSLSRHDESTQRGERDRPHTLQPNGRNIESGSEESMLA